MIILNVRGRNLKRKIHKILCADIGVKYVKMQKLNVGE